MERLLFLGSILVLLCFVEGYFSTATSYFEDSNSASITVQLIDKLEPLGDTLNLLYEGDLSAAKTAQELAGLRKQLKLGDSKVDSNFVTDSYLKKLQSIIEDISNTTNTPLSIITKEIDFTKSPKDLLKDLRDKKHAYDIQPVTIWGIETPRLFSFQYGSVDYKIPSSFISTALLVALAPILIGWFSSVLITRQRELILILKTQDYKLLYPYILNLVPVLFDSFDEATGLKEKNRKTRLQIMQFNRVMMAIMRSLVLLLFSAPMICLFVYSMIMTFGFFEKGSILILTICIISFIFMLGLAITLIAQEWVILKNKQFVE